MTGLPGHTGWFGTVLGAPDPEGLGRFYQAVLGGDLDATDPDFVVLHRPDTTTYLACQREDGHIRPVWPDVPGAQQMQAHLDVGVRDVAEAVAAVLALGGAEAAFQPQDNVRVMLDPAGHPFCLYRDDD